MPKLYFGHDTTNNPVSSHAGTLTSVGEAQCGMD